LTLFDEWDSLVSSAIVKLMTAKPKEPSTVCCAPVKSPKLDAPRAEEYAEWFKALADATRIRILNLLANNDEAVCVCDIVKHFPIGQPTVSHHLKILRDTRFVLAERRGTFMYYRVNRKCLAEFPHAARLILNV